MVARRITAELLVHMDKIRPESRAVFVLTATNTPWQLDAVTMRCFERRIYTALPDLYTRMKIFETAVGVADFDLTPANYRELAELPEACSVSDITAIVQDALL